MTRERKKKGRPVSGWVIFDKPKGMRSTEAVSQIKRLFEARKAGHAGTLDPLASGMLPIALGEATKTVPYVMEGAKTYYFRVAWGEERSTDDLEGEITKISPKRPTQEDILSLLPKYIGVIFQTPPQFSAIKIAGNRAYDLAREGKTVEILPRQVKIDTFKLVETTVQGHSIFEITCRKGTYVRSLARDMGRDLGCYGYIADLRRTAVAPFNADDLITWNKLEEEARYEGGTDKNQELSKKDFSALDRLLIETESALNCLSHYALNEVQAQYVKTGNPISLYNQNTLIDVNDVYVTYKGQLLAIGALDENQFRPKRIFTL
ncbi:tRNA pseudouridine synthase B [Bartonella australis AUST/NH1]|uniref:tRNA pseudouridine synthase B n=1 Tax=Bartonella australis (strain Aust/NH1) TaxID=1094489 RepID=M1N2B4_BARAA|nr:tRNA pseudouridine(55) synthase TruB [Bartonella australis]AGF74034.1 tRNA pseudouridine synthase B [Bartonella australis AUST/NH1]